MKKEEAEEEKEREGTIKWSLGMQCMRIEAKKTRQLSE